VVRTEKAGGGKKKKRRGLFFSSGPTGKKKWERVMSLEKKNRRALSGFSSVGQAVVA